jgi:hypothetical protein
VSIGKSFPCINGFNYFFHAGDANDESLAGYEKAKARPKEVSICTNKKDTILNLALEVSAMKETQKQMLTTLMAAISPAEPALPSPIKTDHALLAFAKELSMDEDLRKRLGLA